MVGAQSIIMMICTSLSCLVHLTPWLFGKLVEALHFFQPQADVLFFLIYAKGKTIFCLSDDLQVEIEDNNYKRKACFFELCGGTVSSTSICGLSTNNGWMAGK